MEHKRPSSANSTRSRYELSIPGISHAKQRGAISSTRKAIWLCFFCLGLGLTGYQVITVVSDYWRYPVRTMISVEDQSHQQFPAVTVCPYNKINCISFVLFMMKCFKDESCSATKVKTLCHMTFHSGCGIVAAAVLDASDRLLLKNTCPIAMQLQDEAMKDPYAVVDLIDGDLLLERYAYLTPEERVEIGMTAAGQLLECKIAEKTDCAKVFNVTTMNTVSNGNCYTFNAKGEVGKIQSGPSMGMEISFKLNRELFAYTPNNHYDGLRVTIHNPSQYPLIEEQGVNIQPNAATSFALEVTKVSRQPHPYPAHCISRWGETSLKIIELTSEEYVTEKFSNYTMTSCSRFCILMYIMRECDCVWYNYDDYNTRDAHRKMGIEPNNYCSPNNESQMMCIQEGMHVYNKSSCGCYPNCKQDIYDVKTSSAKWPSEVQWVYQALKHNFTYHGKPIDFPLILTNCTTGDAKAYKKAIQENLQSDMAKIQVYFGTSMTTMIAEEPIYPSVFDLFINLGGALSLWMGFSFIMVVEVIEMGIDTFVGSISAGYMKKH